MPDSDLDALLAAAEAAADVAGAVIRPFYRSGIAAALKDDRSPVTIADRSAEQAMRAVLAERFPEHAIEGEEFGTDRPGARYRWVLDPVDGTRAFLTGRPLFGTLIGLLDEDRPILGIIDQPISGERWVGAEGRPTTFRGPGRIGVRPCATLDQAELSCTAPEIFDTPDLARFRRLQSATRRTTWGGDCYAYGLIALGGIDVIAEAGLKPYDWTALVPILQGAGARITDWTGAPLHPGSDGHVLAVGDPALLDAAIAALASTDLRRPQV